MKIMGIYPNPLKTIIKYFISTLLIFSMFSQSLKFSFLVYEYLTNNKAFTEKYCQNIDKPALKCNGKCHLKNELAKTSVNDKPINSEQKQNTNYQTEILFFEIVSWYQFPSDFYLLNKIINSNYANLYCDLFTNSSFHPPQNILFIA